MNPDSPTLGDMLLIMALVVLASAVVIGLALLIDARHQRRRAARKGAP